MLYVCMLYVLELDRIRVSKVFHPNQESKWNTVISKQSQTERRPGQLDLIWALSEKAWFYLSAVRESLI